MALPEDGDLLFSDVLTEYGLSGDVNLSDMYGMLNVQTGGDLKLSDFFGKRNETISEFQIHLRENTFPGALTDDYGYAELPVGGLPQQGNLDPRTFTTSAGQEFTVHTLLWEEGRPGTPNAGQTALRLRMTIPNVLDLLDFIDYLNLRSRTLTIIDEYVETLVTGRWTAELISDVQYNGVLMGSNPLSSLVNTTQTVSWQDIIDE